MANCFTFQEFTIFVRTYILLLWLNAVSLPENALHYTFECCSVEILVHTSLKMKSIVTEAMGPCHHLITFRSLILVDKQSLRCHLSRWVVPLVIRSYNFQSVYIKYTYKSKGKCANYNDGIYREVRGKR